MLGFYDVDDAVDQCLVRNDFRGAWQTLVEFRPEISRKDYDLLEKAIKDREASAIV
jgi:hypothetical protein